MRLRSVVLLLLLLAASARLQAQNPDINCLRYVCSPEHPRLNRTMHFVSKSVAPAMIAVPVGLLVYNAFRKDMPQYPNGPYVVGGSVVATSIVCLGVKLAVHRPRPFVAYPEILTNEKVGPYSFPSAHTANAFALATSLTLAYPKWYVAVPAMAWAITVGYSRMRLGVHFPSDVIAGMIIGSGCAMLGYAINKSLVRN
jgi:hypothetical protein